MGERRQDSQASERRKTATKRDRAWFERKVAELKAELEKLPVDRQEQLRRDLEHGEPGKAEE